MCDINICRICLNIKVRGYKMDEYNLRESYEQLMGVKVNDKDGLPRWLCYECTSMFHKFHKFKEKSLQGQTVLNRLLKCGNISYEAIGKINRYHENLASTVCIFTRNSLAKTVYVKHKPKYNPEVTEVETVPHDLDSDDYLEKDDTSDKFVHKINRHISIVEHDEDDEKLVESVEIKSEISPPAIESLENLNKTLVSKTFCDTKVTNNTGNGTGIVNDLINITNNHSSISNNDSSIINNAHTNISDTDINDDMNNMDHIENAISSDEDNIFLDIVREAVKDKNELDKSKKKLNTEDSKVSRKALKFTKPKKESLNPIHWRKYNLSEEDAMHEFKQLEFSDKYVNANYKCHNCYKGFSKSEMLMRHMKFRHEKSGGPIECRFCHVRFQQKSRMCKHMKLHYTVFQCLRCDMRFRIESSAVFHEDYHNGVIRKCKHCGEEFRHPSTYYTHLRMLHRSAHLCTICGASFVSDVGLQRHKRIKHYEKTDEGSNEATSKPGAESEGTYCSQCDIQFVSRAAYDEHLTHTNMHDDLEPDTKRKNMKGNRKSFLRYEPRRNKPTTCQYCDKTFGTQSLCMKHHLAEHPGRPFHSPDKRHICEVCGASLAAVSIATHMNMHTREHVYPCATCGMKFISKTSYNRHQVTHTGERPYPCPLCDKRYTQRNSMKLHYRTFHLKLPYPKRNRRKKTDEMPILESMMTCSDDDTNDAPPRWRPTVSHVKNKGGTKRKT